VVRLRDVSQGVALLHRVEHGCRGLDLNDDDRGWRW
jgi:hypothetical protein